MRKEPTSPINRKISLPKLHVSTRNRRSSMLFLPIDVQANRGFFMPVNGDISLRRCNDNGLP